MLQQKIEELAAHCAQFRKPDHRKAVAQLVITVVLFFGLIGLMIASLQTSYWITLALALPASGMIVRFFIIQHDCGHGSFFASKTANDVTGRIISIITVTPYAYWQRSHALHHATSANLDRRGFGDIDTLTLAEYRELPLARRIGYRIYRNPFFMTFVGGVLHFIVLQRFPFTVQKRSWNMTSSVLALNLAILVVYGAIGTLMGWMNFFLVFAPVVVLSSAAGVWLFYVQHQFEETHWSKDGEWDRKTAAVLGSSYYELPAVLNWFTGNIGLHHIHHLCSHIPNYRLQECMAAKPELADINRLTIWESLKCARLALWDEDNKRLVSFAHA